MGNIVSWVKLTCYEGGRPIYRSQPHVTRVLLLLVSHVLRGEQYQQGRELRKQAVFLHVTTTTTPLLGLPCTGSQFQNLKSLEHAFEKNKTKLRGRKKKVQNSRLFASLFVEHVLKSIKKYLVHFIRICIQEYRQWPIILVQCAPTFVVPTDCNIVVTESVVNRTEPNRTKAQRKPPSRTFPPQKWQAGSTEGSSSSSSSSSS